MNPMIRKELRQRMRERRGWMLPSLLPPRPGRRGNLRLLPHHGGARPIRYSGVYRRGGSVSDPRLRSTRAVAATGPIFSAGSITIEKEQRTLAGLLTSLLASAQILWGKFVSSVLLLLVTSLPVLSMAFAFGGIGPWEIFSATLTTVIILASMSAIGLYCSSAFRRSVHATAVSYAVVAISVVTTIVFFVRLQLYESAHSQVAHAGDTWYHIPLNIRAPMYVNPFFFLTASFAPPKQLYPAWITCACVFIAIGALAVALTLRNLRRSGEL